MKRSSRALFTLAAGAAVGLAMTACGDNGDADDGTTTTPMETTVESPVESPVETPMPGAPGPEQPPATPDDGTATIEIPTPDLGEPDAPEPSPAP